MVHAKSSCNIVFVLMRIEKKNHVNQWLHCSSMQCIFKSLHPIKYMYIHYMDAMCHYIHVST